MNAKLGTIVAAGLAGVLLLCVIAIAVLAGLDKSAPGVLENLAAGALGALAALLARVGGADEVRVVNTAAEPVPVDPEAGWIDTFEVVVVGLLIVLVLLVVGVL